MIASLPARRALATFVVVRVLASVAALLGAAGVPSQPTLPAGGYSKPAYSRGLELLAGVWEKSDALWYIHIARDGYDAKTADAAFMPLYPVLIRTLEWPTNLPWIVAALLVSNLAFLAALYFFYRLVETDFDQETAKRAIGYLALFPGAFFLLAPYTESLFLLLAILAFYFARTGKWWEAGVAGLLLSLTRTQGALILIPLLVEVFRQRRGLVRAALVLIGPVFLVIFWYFKTGDGFAFLRIQGNWEREAAFPWTTVLGGISQAWEFAATYPGAVYLMEAFAVLMAIVAGGFAVKRLPPSYSAFLWLNLLPPLVSPYPGRMLMSCTRFVAVLFPVFIVLAMGARKDSWDQAIRIGFAGIYGLAVALFVANQNLF